MVGSVAGQGDSGALGRSGLRLDLRRPWPRALSVAPRALSVALVALSVALLAPSLACTDGSRRFATGEPNASEPATEPAGRAPEPGSAVPGAGSLALDPSPTAGGPGRERSSGQATADPLAQAAPAAEGGEGASAAGQRPAPDAPAEPVDVFEVMRAGGWELAMEEDLADYLPIPPRAQGQIGRFTRANLPLSVARVTYPAEVFADPHESWIRERIATLPQAHERVVRRGATVVHIRAESAVDADDAARLFEAAMGATGDEG
jgi:hypothetical protein